MKEFVTDAIVLGVRPRGSDRVADLLTPALGRLEARMVAGRAIVSKFSPHCDPPSLVTVRLVKKIRYTLADAVGKSRFARVRRTPSTFGAALGALFAIRALAPKEVPDARLFYGVRRALESGQLTARDVLPMLGYDPAEARCVRCRAPAIRFFIPADGVFVCSACVAGRGDEVLLNV
ncbi:MAG: hypothetical protein HYU81_01485 [Candidatus Brennerbacteria bacterium]|nr:hypothetical protein [Candidatus Brennerbacteria bacterium]